MKLLTAGSLICVLLTCHLVACAAMTGVAEFSIGKDLTVESSCS